MFKNLNEKDKKKIYTLLSLGVVCAIALIVIPSFDNSKDELEKKLDENQNKEVSKESEQTSLEGKLKSILSQIEGAGDVDVMITYDSSEEIEPAFNTNSSTEKTEEKDQKGGERTVTVSNENKTMITNSNQPIVIKTKEAQIKGVIVVSSGASDPKIKQTLYGAVQTALQIQGHQVEIYSK